MKKLLNFIKNILPLKDRYNKSENTNSGTSTKEDETILVSKSVEENKEIIKKIFYNCIDLITREVKSDKYSNSRIMIVYIANLIDKQLIEETVINKLTMKLEEPKIYPIINEHIKYLFGVNDEDIHTDINKVVDSILKGQLILFLDGVGEAFIINISNPPGRNIEEPKVETIIRGPREGFTESIETNIALLRKIIRCTELKMESFIIGRRTKTNVTISYIADISNEKIIGEVRERLNKIDIDGVLGANYIKEYIDDEPLWGFPTMFSTERPDVVASKLLEGRIAILTGGTPLVVTVPAVFVEHLESNEDFYINYLAATFNRWIRYLSFALTLTLPGAYLAITTFHQELIPTALLSTFIKTTSDVPYPALVECLLLFFSYEILREAAIRMPRTVGQTISVVGALILGQAAVEAGLASTPMVIIVAFTAISSFALPSTDMNESLVIPRLVFVLLGSTLGLIGLICGLIVMWMKLISIRSFGIPYMKPIAPIIANEILDIIMRRPLWSKFKRSRIITGRESIRRRQESHIKLIKKEQHEANKKKKNKG